MKKITLLLGTLFIAFACTKKDETKIENVETIVTSPVTDSVAFDLEKIEFTTADLGDFPFFTLPEGLKEMNKPLVKNYDKIYFPINGIMTPFEGKIYKTYVSSENLNEYSKAYFEKSLEDYLTSIGAVKVYDGTITKEEYNRYTKEATNRGDEGDIGYMDENIKFFVIRSKDKGNVFVQFSSTDSSGKLNILQQEALKQTIKKVTADDIVKDLSQKGKSILYINFDVDKSNVTSDGKEIINQIAAALKKDASLKILIEGHTDNTGDGAHNKKLSNDRANEVMKNLIANGIDQSRLQAKGFGAENPLVANDSEENKAKNRRVELIKL